MEIHERFMKLPTTGVNVVESFAGIGERVLILQELVALYNKKISNDDFDLKTLETFRMILCYEYQTLVNSCSGNEPPKRIGRRYKDLTNFLIKNNEYRKREKCSVLYDIVVLQLALSHKDLLMTSFKNFCETQGFGSSSENSDLAMTISECFVDSYNLHTYLYKSEDNSAELEEQSTRILMIIQSWMKQEEDIEWKLLASLLPKVTITFDPRKIISSLWHRVIGSLNIVPSLCNKRFNDIADLDKKLAALCVMADVCFPSEKEKVQEFHYEQCVQDEFWWILNRGLISTVFQQRKRALYLVKRAVEFVETHELEIKQLKPLEKSIVPFICNRSDARESLEEIKNNFFLILEVLEEKQKHLVLSALSHLPSLVNVHANPEIRYSFNPIWLRCIFTRILQHDNDSIKMFGLQEILKSDPHIFFDNHFLYYLVDVLNNTFLYEYNIDEKKPQIVKKLEECLLRWEQEKITLINSFIRALSSVSWGPVAIYWILEALLGVSEQCKIVINVWKLDELLCVKDLIQKNLSMHNLQLRTYSQMLIIRIFQAYASVLAKPSTLDCIFNILSSLPENESLKPGSETWIQITEHLSKIIIPSDAVQYVTERCEKLFTDEQSLKSFALIIAFLLDSKLIHVSKPCTAMKSVENLFQNLVGADRRPYADQDAILKIIELSGHLLNLASHSTSAATEEIKTLMIPYINEIMKIVSRSLERKGISAYDKYEFVIMALIGSWHSSNLAVSKDPCWQNLEKELERFEKKCIDIIANPHNFCKIQWSYAINVLYICRENISFNRLKSEQTYLPPLLRYFKNEVVANGQGKNAAQQNKDSKGKFPTDCFKTIAMLVHQCIEASTLASRPPNINWFQELLALVETGNEHVIPFVAVTLYLLLKETPSPSIQDLDSVNSIIRLSWRSVFQLKKTPVFFSALMELTHLILSENFLKLDGAKEYAIECVDQMMREGDSVPSLKRIFLSSMTIWMPENMLNFQKAFTSCLLHSAVPRRDQSIKRAAISHGQKFNNTETFSILDLSIDTTVRAKAVVNLLKMINSDSPASAQFLENVLNDLLDILKQNKNKRYFDNSHLHRLKHRVMQILLILEPCLNETETQSLYDTVCDLLIAESNQPSVRLMQEWLLIRLYSKNAVRRETIWTLFETAAEKRPGCIVSLASVVIHVARLLNEHTQTEYIGKAISRLLPNCMGQQFNVRLYSQTILVKIYEMLPNDSPEAKAYREIFKGVEESLCRGNLLRNSTRVLDDFYFNIFDPVLDYNLETIYYELPRLTNVSIDEWIAPGVFDEMCVCNITLINEERGELRMAKPYAQSSKVTGELAEYADSSIESGLSDIQKKIIPWKTMVPFHNDLSEVSKAKLLQRKMKNEEEGLIVVASLIDRPPNLGGLARTCEIFGAKELVIGSLRYAEDREFQTLSVSAEKWITITEVKPHLLQNYLLEKQSEKWKLVGAEQTAKSTNLLAMNFPKKTILVLGNEKDGIPANLIPLLDTCVEIPQNGVVRSLNVHVTGAICIWQYAKQHILT